MNLGDLNYPCTIYRNLPTAGLGGVVVDNFTVFARLFATKKEVSSFGVITSARDANQTESIFVTRWVPGIATGMKLVVDEREYWIQRADEMGRREGWKIYAREIT